MSVPYLEVSEEDSSDEEESLEGIYGEPWEWEQQLEYLTRELEDVSEPSGENSGPEISSGV